MTDEENERDIEGWLLEIQETGKYQFAVIITIARDGLVGAKGGGALEEKLQKALQDGAFGGVEAVLAKHQQEHTH